MLPVLINEIREELADGRVVDKWGHAYKETLTISAFSLRAGSAHALNDAGGVQRCAGGAWR